MEQLLQTANSAPPPVVMPEKLKWLFHYRKSSWEFLTKAVYTLDQVDKQNPIKKYPDKEHLRIAADIITKERLLALVKHRRMMQTWTCCAIALWEAMLFEGQFVSLISKKEADSDDLVRRCRFIYEHIPDSAMPVKPKMVYKYTELRFPETDSIIKGLAQGADQLRQYTCSRIFADEFAFWPEAEDTFVAMKPTLEGGGKICLLSTRYPGFFKKIVEDTIDDN